MKFEAYDIRSHFLNVARVRRIGGWQIDASHHCGHEQPNLGLQRDEGGECRPGTETRHRKPLEPNELAEWEVRIGAYRVFYDVDTTEATVKIKAVGSKLHNTLTIREREYSL